MSSPLVLRPCETVTYDGAREPVRCDQPATWWAAPNGKSYLVCKPHAAGFLHGLQEARRIP